MIFSLHKVTYKKKNMVAKYSVHKRTGSTYRLFRMPYFTLLSQFKEEMTAFFQKEKKVLQNRTSQSVRDTLNIIIKYTLQLAKV